MKLEELNREGQKFNDWMKWWKRESLKAIAEATLLDKKDNGGLELDDDALTVNMMKWHKIQQRISFLDKNGAEKVGELRKYKSEVGNFFMKETFLK